MPPQIILPEEMDTPRFIPMVQLFSAGFPPTSSADEDGFLCHGGTLAVPALLAAYSKGIFPWFSQGEPILWWTLAPRCVLLPEQYHLPRRAARKQASMPFVITLDTAFDQVLDGCANRNETWLTQDIHTAYSRMFRLGFAHSVEAWLDGELVGGLYGITIGRAFFGESMFHTVPEASRACLKALTDLLRLRGIVLLDCQQQTQHIMMQGGIMLERDDFEGRLCQALALDPASDDALTLEYEGDPDLRKEYWPYLPWQQRYIHKDGAWQALP